MLGAILYVSVVLLTTAAAIAILVVRELTHPPRHTAAYAIVRRLPVDPAADGLAFEEWTLQYPDGTTLPVWEVPPDGGEVATMTIIHVHDRGESRIDAFARTRQWRRPGLRHLYYDRRGHGEAIGLARLGSGEVHDLLALVERLEGPIVLSGWGEGAAIATRAATDAEVGASIVGLILIDAERGSIERTIEVVLRHYGLPVPVLHPLIAAVLYAIGIRRAEHDRPLPERVRVLRLDGDDSAEEKTPEAAEAAIRGFLDQLDGLAANRAQSAARSV